MVVSVLFSGRDHRSLDGGPWPGERSARSRQARSAAEDGGRRLFCLARNAATLQQGKKAGVAVAGRRSRRSRPSGLIRPFEVAWDAPIKQTDGDHHGCYRRCGTRIWHHGSNKDARPRIPEGNGATWRTMAHDSVSRRCRSRPRLKTRRIQFAISMSQMADRSTPIYASLVKGDGDNSFTLIWSRRNGD
jgi:hypothetical protein